MPRKTDTRQRLLQTAAALFRSQGYHATGMNHILQTSGAPKGSLYFHFPGGKEQLAAESVTLAGKDVSARLMNELANIDDPRKAISALVELFANTLRKTDFHDGCPVATVALDVASESEKVRESCADVYRSWQESLANYFRQCGMSKAQATEFALTTITTIEGALLLAKTLRDIQPLKIAEKHLTHTVEWELKNARSSP